MAVSIPSAPHNGEATDCEHAASVRFLWRWLKGLKNLHCRSAKKPHSIGGQLVGRPRVHRVLEEHRCSGKRRPKVLRSGSAQRQQPAAIRIADVRHRTVRMTKHDKEVKHRPHTLADYGCHFESGLRAENQEVEV